MENKSYELVEAFWNNWSHSLTSLASTAKQMEQFTLEAMKHQQESLQKMVQGLEAMEQEMKQHTMQAGAQYAEYMKQFAAGQFSSQIEEWQKKWNEVSQQMQQTSVSPAKVSLNALAQTAGQLEEAFKQVLSQQHSQREEAQKQMNQFMNELKTMQLELLRKTQEGAKQFLPSL
ncbi:polyhydroxyalkanoic acid inclusion protein PhaP [Ectobacillus antri]|jgi:polyhydroxyalkanoic acid inclusion protein PhaP|uniref:Polyhydroxyalkanoic acid inclusion protein PhaP n=1 Tax=Ectobacillus antri TaxID=2486280 RepID=A0ABT6H2Z5_9BACI|nr:polyhydroxyalkanoic acid inclusion protein PhaP [Ectobacillus antri]MDG4657452.1 polyhydroxyalkanoic acid inclusion protein PhaP [Ectobacillus antri]MDG5753765.1 polyhydroxyalkanoic acid inclusion protein PhaP [Ectobacillus antri]